MHYVDIFTVELKYENSLMNVVIDNFGEKVVVRPADCDHFIATVEVAANPPLYTWIFTFGGKIKILSPESIVNEFKTQLEETLKINSKYKERDDGKNHHLVFIFSKPIATERMFGYNIATTFSFN